MIKNQIPELSIIIVYSPILVLVEMITKKRINQQL